MVRPVVSRRSFPVTTVNATTSTKRAYIDPIPLNALAGQALPGQALPGQAATAEVLQVQATVVGGRPFNQWRLRLKVLGLS